MDIGIFKCRKAVIRIINLKVKAYAAGIDVVKGLVIFSPSKCIIQYCEGAIKLEIASEEGNIEIYMNLLLAEKIESNHNEDGVAEKAL